MDGTLFFLASTNIKSLIGKDLITDQMTAVFELVKNAYDADAEMVNIDFLDIAEDNGRLVIADNGIGMNMQDLKDKWMVIGTDSKRDLECSEKFQRPISGDKGIGRFSADRLGRYLTLITVKEGTNEEVTARFDWTDFEKNYADLNSIKIPYSVKLLGAKAKRGSVKLEISGLRDQWGKVELSRLIKNLRQLKSPLEVEDNFRIRVNAWDHGIYDADIHPFNLEDISSLYVKARIPLDNTSKIHMEITRDGIGYKEVHSNLYNFGPAEVVIYFFDKGDKQRFASRLGVTVKAFGNIRLYLDSFRVYPYGDSLNDWLDLDIRHAQGMYRFVGSRDVIGYVQIYKRHNTGFIPTTNRQGLVENDCTEELRKFIIEYPIKALEKYFFQKPKSHMFQEARNSTDSAVVELNRVAKQIQDNDPEAARTIRRLTGVVQESQSNQAQFVRSQEELLSVYKRVASKEVLLHEIIHQTLIKIGNIRSAAKSGKRNINESIDPSNTLLAQLEHNFSDIDRIGKDAENYLLQVRNHLIRERTKEYFNLKAFTLQIMNDHKEMLAENDINFKLESPDDMTFRMDKNDLKVIIENFASNSVKSLARISNRIRQFKIKITQNDRYVIFIFRDNGSGVPEHLRDRIFDPFFTTTDGFGRVRLFSGAELGM